MSEDKLEAQGKLVGARQPGVESKGGQGSPLQNPGCYRARLLFSFQEGQQRASTFPCLSVEAIA